MLKARLPAQVRTFPWLLAAPYVVLILAAVALAAYLHHGAGQVRVTEVEGGYCTGDGCPWWTYSGLWIAIFTFLTVCIFVGQLRAMLRTNEHYRVTERAYVKISHFAPGIYWVMPQKEETRYSEEKNLRYGMGLYFRAKNFGRTPASVV